METVLLLLQKDKRELLSKLKQAGAVFNSSETRYNCPFCGDKNWRTLLYYADRETVCPAFHFFFCGILYETKVGWRYKCGRCKEEGNIWTIEGKLKKEEPQKIKKLYASLFKDCPIHFTEEELLLLMPPGKKTVRRYGDEMLVLVSEKKNGKKHYEVAARSPGMKWIFVSDREWPLYWIEEFDRTEVILTDTEEFVDFLNQYGFSVACPTGGIEYGFLRRTDFWPLVHSKKDILIWVDADTLSASYEYGLRLVEAVRDCDENVPIRWIGFDREALNKENPKKEIEEAIESALPVEKIEQ